MEHQNRRELSQGEISELAQRIQKLTDQQVDALLDEIGFRVFKSTDAKTPGEYPFKAATHQFLKNLRKDFKSARDITISLVSECDVEKLQRKLNQLAETSPRRPT